MYEYGPPRLPSLLRHWCGCKIDKSRQELLQSKLFSRTLIVTVSPYYLTQGGSVTGARMHYPVCITPFMAQLLWARIFCNLRI